MLRFRRRLSILLGLFLLTALVLGLLPRSAVGRAALPLRDFGIPVDPSPTAGAPQPSPTLAPPAFRWSEATTPHFRLRYYPGSPAERDIEQLEQQAEAALRRAQAVLPATEPISITAYLVPRLFWQGGAAFDDGSILITYADRNYAGVDASLYFTHEVTHALANRFVARGGDVGGLIGEGLAVYAAGGHYGPEPIDDWAAGLQRSPRYVPLCRLRATWPGPQREIAYLEAASFVGYLIRTYGPDRFRDFYTRDPGLPHDAPQNVDAFCAAEAKRPVAGIGKTYAELEAGWRRELEQRQPAPEQLARFSAQIRFFDLLRRYQERRDPAARILPPPPARWDDKLRRAFAGPATDKANVVAETLFIAADAVLDRGDAARANAIMDQLQTGIETNAWQGLQA